MNDRTTKVSLITGSGRKRVGNVVARFLAKRGNDIALHYNSSQESASATCAEIEEMGVQCQAFQADVGCDSEVQEMVDRVCERFGRLDVVVTTASIWGECTLEATTKEELRRNFDINTLGTFFTARAAGRRMIEQSDGGVIVTIGDWAIRRPYIDHAAYFLSKGAIPTLTRVMAHELGSRNSRVRVNCIEPGPVMFPPDASEQRKKRLKSATLTDHTDCPEMVAHAVQHFIDNKFVTGVCLPVDGGRHMFSPDDA